MTFQYHYDQIVRSWLENRFEQRDESGIYFAHEPIYGVGVGPTEGGHARRALRLYDLLSILKQLPATSLLDVGAAEGYLAFLAREVLGLKVSVCDLARAACERAAGIFHLDATPASSNLIPFPDNSFDIVTITEVIEHVGDPVGSILEAQRIARRFVLITTEEWHPDSDLRDHILRSRSLDNHMERNVFSLCDIPTLFGQCPVFWCPQRFPIESEQFADASLSQEKLLRLVTSKDLTTKGGVLLLAAVGDTSIPMTSSFSNNPNVNLDVIEALVRGVEKCPLPLEAPRFETLRDEYKFIESRENITRLCDSLKIEVARRVELLELDRKFAIDPLGKRNWWIDELRNEDHGWTHSQLSTTSDGWLLSTGDDPQVVSPFLGIPLDEITTIEIEIGYFEKSSVLAEVFFLFDGMMIFNQEISVSIVLSGDLSVYRLCVKIPDSMKEQYKYLVRMRFDPVSSDQSTQFHLNSIRINP